MNVLKAAEETLVLAEAHGMDICSSDEPSLDYPHLLSMLKRMEEDSSMSYGKQCRWLGWIQAAVVAFGSANDSKITLEHMKEINKRNAG